MMFSGAFSFVDPPCVCGMFLFLFHLHRSR